ncbi:hypothetical protein BpHYR1_043893, partial [Brachionus plicatilis]
CFPIDQTKTRPTHQQIIYTNIGQTINISCVFDSRWITNSQLDTDMKNFPNDINHSIPSYPFSYEDDIEDYKKRRKKRLARSTRSLDAFNYDVYEPNSKVEPFSIVNTYELDWYFLDKKGRLNIVSYGNQTRSRFKYKTFVKRLSDKDSNEKTPYSSALYSSSSNLRSRSEQPARKSSGKEYFLSVLIESEQDEGIYQCINPDMPSLILKNATVLLSRNDSSRFSFSLFI